MKKKLSLTMAMILLVIHVFSFQVFADHLPEGPVITGEDLEAAAPPEILQPSEEMITELVQSESEMDTTKLKQHQTDLSATLKSITTKSKSSAHEMNASPQSISTSAETSTYIGYIQQEGTSAFLYPFYVNPGDILQVQLDSPALAQLDYDLYLYEFDMSTGDLNPNPIDYSIYGTHLNNYADGSRTLSENVGTKNTTSAPKAYLMEVYGAVGASINEPFYLTVSTSSTYDPFETDENAFRAYPFTVALGGSSIVSRSINSEVDQDWYAITVPASRNYDAFQISLDQASVAAGYKAELYGALSGNRMTRISSDTGKAAVGTGTYYLRVYTTNSYSDTNYTLHVQPILRADRIVITGYNSNGGPNDYPSYAYGRFYRITGNSFTVNGVVATSDNYAVANAEVEVIWENSYWTEGSGNRYRSGTVTTNSRGEFSITLSLPSPTASLSQFLPGAINFTHYFDLCGVLARVTDRPSVNTIDRVYHFAYSIRG